MHHYIALALFLLLVVGGGIAIGIGCPPGEWHARLVKPAFNPPNWLFAPVWTLLYILISIAGWRVFAAGATAALAVWAVQLALNFAWSPVFFRAHATRTALAIVAALLVAILVFMAFAWPLDRFAALLFAPYALWVAFATALNAAIVRLN